MQSRWITCDMVFTLPPNKPGIYVIYFDGKLSYVGQAQNLKTRLDAQLRLRRYSAHFETRWGDFIDVSVKYKLSSRYGDWDMWELRLLRKLKPKFNSRQTVNAKQQAALFSVLR